MNLHDPLLECFGRTHHRCSIFCLPCFEKMVVHCWCMLQADRAFTLGRHVHAICQAFCWWTSPFKPLWHLTWRAVSFSELRFLARHCGIISPTARENARHVAHMAFGASSWPIWTVTGIRLVKVSTPWDQESWSDDLHVQHAFDGNSVGECSDKKVWTFGKHKTSHLMQFARGGTIFESGLFVSLSLLVVS